MKRNGATKGRNGYCGPFALAWLAGQNSDWAAAQFRRLTGKRACRGVNNRLMTLAIYRSLPPELQRECGIRIYTKPQPTFAQWLRRHREPSHHYLLNVTGHYVIVRGRTLYDNNNPDGIPVREYKQRKRVKQQWRFPCPK